MTTPLPEVAALAVARSAATPFDPAEELTRLHRKQPLTRVVYPDGHIGWLVTGRGAARAVLADSRFSSRIDDMHIPVDLGQLPEEDGGFTPPQPPPGEFTNIDGPEHARYRGALTGQFTVRRMRQLTERVESFTADCLDAMEYKGSPADLVEAFAKPIPAMVICDLLGVPYEAREQFQRKAEIIVGNEGDVGEMYDAFGELQRYLSGLVRQKRLEPTDDLLSGLTTSDLTDEELTNIGVVLLGAGLDTTANMLALGAFALLREPEQLDAWRAEPELTDSAVEELLRYLSIIPYTVRAATVDVALAGHLIKAGESVTLSIQAANRDPEHFPDPARLDLRRSARGHLSFAHGIHQCLGQQLARVELRVAFPALLRRFPGLRLAVPPGEVPLRTGGSVYGLRRLPVTW